ncbi:hypothetical protein Pfo_015568 [Paulownia fortunei]|nr:hypothetical protein Pfo_015568 [Paulownia fortunei]
MRYTMIKILLLFLFVEVNILQEFVAGCFLTLKHDVHIKNYLPPNSAPLKLHCASKNDDLGYHTLYTNQEFHWSFCENFFPNTLFFCHLWWGSKDKAFDSFKESTTKPSSQSYWIAMSDGIYFFDNSYLPVVKKYDWNN